MAMFNNTFIFTSNSIHLQPTKHLLTSYNTTLFKPHTLNLNLHVPRVSSTPQNQPINVNYLQTEFNCHGTSFTTLGDSCVVRLSLDNGSVATLMLPSGLVTSYKAPMWHGGLLELLHTSVTSEEEVEGDGDGENVGGVSIRGGVSVVLRCEGSGNGGVVWEPSFWDLRSVCGAPDESIKVELISSNSEEKIEIKHIVTLQQDAISSEIVITNLRPSPLKLMGSIIGHLAISTPEATYAIGLESSNYFVKPPIYSNFSIVPPDFSNNDSSSKNSFEQLLSGWGLGSSNDRFNDRTSKNEQEDEDIEGEEEENYKHLTEKMSMIYTSAPRSLTIMDRGKRNSVIVSREGFDELYIFSPGSRHKSYGKYSYICIGHAALLKPITIGPQSEWRGVQHLHNPNM